MRQSEHSLERRIKKLERRMQGFSVPGPQEWVNDTKYLIEHIRGMQKRLINLEYRLSVHSK